ncbi:MAG: hypothetical protein ACRCZF_05400, partial [Gemmataceae bacterium]
MTRTRRSLWTLGLGSVNAVLALVLGLVTPPLLLAWLGDERVGAYRIGMEYLGYLTLLDLGLAGTLQAQLAKSFAEQNRTAVLAQLVAGMRAFSRLALFIALAVVAIALIAPSATRGLSPELLGEFRLGLLAYALLALLTPLSVMRVVADAEQKGYRTQISQFLQTLATAGLTIGAAYLGGGLLGQFFATVLAT